MGGSALHAGLVRLHTHTPLPVDPHALTHAKSRARAHTHTHTNIHNLLFFHDNSAFVNSPQSLFIRTLPLLLYIISTKLEAALQTL